MNQYQCILVPVDASPASIRAVRQGAMLAQVFQSKLIILQVAPLVSVVARLERQDPEQVSPAGEKRESQLASYYSCYIPSGVEPEYLSLDGRPGPEILRVATDRGCDLIVMGNHGLSRLKEILIGSVCLHVVQHSHCPVLVVK